MLIGLSAGLVIGLVFVVSAVPLRSDTLKKRIIETLAERLDSDVSVDDLSLRVLPGLHAEGFGLNIRQRRQRGRAASAPPLIAIRSFTVDASLLGLWRKRVAHVSVSGLVISILPNDDSDDGREDHRQEIGGRSRRPHRLHETAGTGAPPPGTATTQGMASTTVIIDTLDTRDAQLVIIPRDRKKAPKIWAIHQLHLQNVGAAQSMPYQARVTNGVPPGEIVTSGNFGPWDRNDPGATPLDGGFTFDNADLSVFNGIGGTLASRGSFDGTLSWIEVYGETDTPNFVVSVGNHPFPLHAKYQTIVDGTNGDTRLERIDADFLQSSLVARGDVLDGPPGQKGRTVRLDIDMQKARIEDVMRMAIKAETPPMIGALQLTTTFLLPPGETDVADRLVLKGRFALLRAKFTNDSVQAKIVELSHRGRGRSADQKKEAVRSDFRGRFVLGDGNLVLRDLTFGVPGAQVKLAGRYGIKSETLAFTGSLRIDARVSQTVSGFKSVLLRIADPLFNRPGGGSEIPIKIEGTRSDPKFGLDVRRVIRRSGSP
jgi:hypothetical protein